MTTLACDGHSLAADGQRSAGNEIIASDTKKIHVESGTIYAFTGEVAPRALIDWIAAGAHADKAPKIDFSALVIDRTGARRYSNELPYAQEVRFPHADGSGDRWAMGAMKAGKSPREAVEIACSLDVYSGGTIQVVELDEVFGRKTVSVINPKTGKRVIRLAAAE